MERSCTSEADSRSADQEIRHLLCNLKVHYHVDKIPPLDPLLSQMNPFHTIPTHFFSSFTPTPGSPIWSHSFMFWEYFVHISYFSYACYSPASYILLYLMTLIIFGEEYKLQIFSLSLLLSPNILLSTLYLNTLNLCSSLKWETKFRTHIKPLLALCTWSTVETQAFQVQELSRCTLRVAHAHARTHAHIFNTEIVLD
jgi:hypothetical protein